MHLEVLVVAVDASPEHSLSPVQQMCQAEQTHWYPSQALFQIRSATLLWQHVAGNWKKNHGHAAAGQPQPGTSDASGLADLFSSPQGALSTPSTPGGSSPSGQGAKTDLLGRRLSSKTQNAFDFIGVSRCDFLSACLGADEGFYSSTDNA